MSFKAYFSGDGIARTGSVRSVDALRRFPAWLEVADFGATAAEVAGQVRSWLASQGTPIGPYDILIAAQARALGVTLVTNNMREFERMPELNPANWAA